MAGVEQDTRQTGQLENTTELTSQVKCVERNGHKSSEACCVRFDVHSRTNGSSAVLRAEAHGADVTTVLRAINNIQYLRILTLTIIQYSY